MGDRPTQWHPYMLKIPCGIFPLDGYCKAQCESTLSVLLSHPSAYSQQHWPILLYNVLHAAAALRVCYRDIGEPDLLFFFCV